ncbi:MAG: GWxTD domain-containing protein [Gemmatimonadaceae bacterium]
MRRVASLLTCALVALAPAPLLSRSAGAQPQLARADSLAGRGDSLAALRLLQATVRDNPQSAAAWNRLGLMSWGLARAERDGRFFDSEPDERLSQLADSSLLIATVKAPGNAAYLIDRGRYLLGSTSSSTRGDATSIFRRALSLAEAAVDSTLVSRAADALGMVEWRVYENRSERRLLGGAPDDASLGGIVNDPEALKEFLERFDPNVAAQEFSGEVAYLNATDLFTRARRADPANLRAARHAFMALAERQRWEELRHLSSMRARSYPEDAWSWLALAVARFRLGEVDAATAAFDSGLRMLDPSERAALTRVSRILRPADSSRYAAMSTAERESAEEFYWKMTDPLWLTPANERRLEFLSRVVFAELAWSAEEYGVTGADTDRGDIYVRYGPPEVIAAFSPNPLFAREHWIRQVWLYPEGFAFLFRMPPGYGVARLASFSAARAGVLRDTMPVLFSNVPASTNQLPLPTRVTRFRADSTGSADLVIAAEVPVDSLVAGLDIVSVPIHTELQIYDWRVERVIHDSSRRIVRVDGTGDAGTRSWRERVVAGDYFYRVEAFQPDAMRGARSGGRITITSDTIFSLQGFGVSDLLIATRAEVRDETRVHRWHDLDIEPTAGSIDGEAGIGMVWETYDLADSAGISRYEVAITLERAEQVPSGPLALVARVVGGLAEAVGIREGGTDRVTLRYSREVPAVPVQVDYLTLDVDGAAPGDYVLTVKVTDLRSGRVAVRHGAVRLGG